MSGVERIVVVVEGVDEELLEANNPNELELMNDNSFCLFIQKQLLSN